VAWTQDRRTGLNAVLYAALRWPTRRRLLWLLGIAASGFVIWLAASHLGPGLRAAHGQGIHGEWTAQEQDNGQWYGEFVSSTGTVTLPHVYYAGSLPAVQAGTTIPVLDTGASDEVYPLAGSGKWVHDVIGIAVGVLALSGLLARGLFTARRRGRATRADGFTQGMMLSERKRRQWRAASRSRAAVLALLAVSVIGYICARLIVLLAEATPYAGWYSLLAIAGGIGIAVGVPWALVRGTRSALWPTWLLIAYTMALCGGMKYYASLQFSRPGSVHGVLPPPSPWFVLQLAGLSAVTLTFVAFTLLLLVIMAIAIAPGPVGGWLRAMRPRRVRVDGHPKPGTPAR
jgi:hypothetical protein